MSASRTIATLAARAGVPAVARRLRRRGRALILMYHRISDEPDYLGMCVPPALFDAHLGRLRQRAAIWPLAALAERLADPRPLERDLAAVTFDDGYRDNLDLALPILARHGAPATLFLTTGFVDRTARPFGDRLLNACRALWARGAGADAWSRGRATVDGLVRAALARPGDLGALRAVDAECKRLPASTSEALVAALEELAGGAPGGVALLDWDGVRALARGGVEIAAHTVTHALLSRVPLARANDELRIARARIEAEVGAPVRGFAYPNGHAADFGAEHVELLARGGYRYACTAERGGNAPGADPFRLRRIGVGADAPALLDLKLALAGHGRPACAA